MSEPFNKPTPLSKSPNYFAYHVRDMKNGEAIWTRIGSAWTHSDGCGVHIQIETAPLDGRICLRFPPPKAE